MKKQDAHIKAYQIHQKTKQCALENYPNTTQYIIQLWRLKMVRFDYMSEELAGLIDAVKRDKAIGIDKKRLNTELLEDLQWLRTFGAKRYIDLVRSDAFICKRPKRLEVSAWARNAMNMNSGFTA